MDERPEQADLADDRRLGFIGMGAMGSRMARRLMNAGYGLIVWDRTPEKTRELQEAGAQVGETPRAVAEACDLLMLCVTDDAAQENVMWGAGGALEGVRAGGVIVDLSTVSPAASRRLHQAAAAKRAAALDAAVSGSLPQVEQGTLAIFVGGDQKAFERVDDVLEELGQGVFYMGGSGTGTTMKLVANTLLGVGMQALAEALSLGEKAGLERTRLLEVLAQTAVVTSGQKAKLGNVEQGRFPSQFALSLMHKDFGLILGQARESTVPMPATAAAAQMFAAAMGEGGDEDFSSVIRYMQQLSGLNPSRPAGADGRAAGPSLTGPT